MGRTLEFALKVNANLDGNLQGQLAAAARSMSAFKQAANMKLPFVGKVGALSGQLSALQGALGQIEKYRAAAAGAAAAQERHAKVVRRNTQAAAEKRAASEKVASLKVELAQMQEARASLKRTTAEYKTLSGQIRATKAELKSAEAAMKAASQAFSGSQNKVFSSGQNLSRQISELQRLRSALSSAGVNINQLAAAESRLQTQIQSTTNSLQRQAEIARRVQSARLNVEGARSNLNEAQSNFQEAGSFAQSMMTPFLAATRNAMDYEYELMNVKALTQMQNLRAGNFDEVNYAVSVMDRTFRHLGATTEYTSLDIAKSAGYFAMAGWDVERIQAVLPAFINLATATRTAGPELARLADVFSDDMTAIGLQAGQMVKLGDNTQVEASQYFADAFAYAVTNANLNRESLHEGVKYFGPVAQQMGLSVAEMMATTMWTANAGIKGSQMGTAFRAGLIRMVAPTKGAEGALAEMGLTMSDAQKEYQEAQAAMAEAGISGDSFIEKIRGMAEYLQTQDSAGRADFINKVFGKNAYSAWAKILENPAAVESIARQAEFMNSAQVSGYAGDTAAIQRESAHVQFELLKSGIDSVINQVGTALLPFVIEASKALAPLMTKLSEWISANPRIVQGVAAVAAGLSALAVGATSVAVAFAGWNFITSQLALLRAILAGMSFSNVVSSVSAIGPAFMSAARAAMAFCLTPIGAVAALLAVTALAVYQNWYRIGPVLSGVAATVGSTLSAAFSTAQSAVGRAVEAIGRLFNTLRDTGALDAFAKGFLAVINVIAGAFSALIDLAGGAVSFIANGVGGLADAISFALEGEWLKAGAALKNLANDSVITVFNTAQKSFRDITSIYSNTRDSWRSYDNAGANTPAPAPIPNLNTSQNVTIPQSNSLPGVQSITEMHSLQLDTSNVQSQLNNFGSSLARTLNAVQVQPKAAPEAPITFGYTPGSYFNVADLAKIEPPKLDTSDLQAKLDNVGSAMQANVQSLQSAMERPTFDYSPGSYFNIANLAKIEPPNIPESYSFSAGQSITESNRIDTSEVQAQLDNFGGAVQANAAAVQAANESAGVQAEAADVAASNLTTGLESANVEAMNLTAAVQQSSAQIQAHSSEMNNNLVIVGQHGAAMSGAVSAIEAMASAAAASAGSITNLSSASSSAGAAIGGLGSAVSAAIASVQAAAVQTSAPAQNYNGGIYNHGAFLTWFAERSPEAAIPLDGSARAISLWQQAGQILGIYPEQNYTGGIYGAHYNTNSIVAQTRSKLSEIIQSGSSYNIMDILTGVGGITGGNIYPNGILSGGEFPMMRAGEGGEDRSFNAVFNVTINVRDEDAGQRIFEDFREQFEGYLREMHRRGFE